MTRCCNVRSSVTTMRDMEQIKNIHSRKSSPRPPFKKNTPEPIVPEDGGREWTASVGLWLST